MARKLMNRKLDEAKGRLLYLWKEYVDHSKAPEDYGEALLDIIGAINEADNRLYTVSQDIGTKIDKLKAHKKIALSLDDSLMKARHSYQPSSNTIAGYLRNTQMISTRSL